VNHKFLEFALINYTVAVEKIKKADIKLIYSYKMTNGIVVMLSRVQFSLLSNYAEQISARQSYNKIVASSKLL
jgi:Ni,Fe-hydrogenase III large subunit